MSRLDEIFYLIDGGEYSDSYPEAKQQIKSLMLELIGEEELIPARKPGITGWYEKSVRNKLRGELRQKVEEL